MRTLNPHMTGEGLKTEGIKEGGEHGEKFFANNLS